MRFKKLIIGVVAGAIGFGAYTTEAKADSTIPPAVKDCASYVLNPLITGPIACYDRATVYGPLFQVFDAGDNLVYAAPFQYATTYAVDNWRFEGNEVSIDPCCGHPANHIYGNTLSHGAAGIQCVNKTTRGLMTGTTWGAWGWIGPCHTSSIRYTIAYNGNQAAGSWQWNVAGQNIPVVWIGAT